jgi:exosome complex component CSL4
MTKENTKIILPGDFVTTEEEFAAGANVYEKDGEIRASIMGSVDFDHEKKEAKINGKTIPVLKEGDIITGRVIKVTETMASINIMGTEEPRAIIVSTGQIPVRNASQSYTEDMRKLFRIGDYVKAKVVMATKLAVDLATNQKGLGVVEAHCKNCRSKMEFSNEKMMCLNCGSVEERKWFASEDIRQERPRDQSRSFGGNRRDSRPSFGGRPQGRSFGGNRRDSRPSFGGRPQGRSFGGNRRDSRPSFGGDRRDNNGNQGNNNFSRNESRGREGFRNENRNNNSRQRRY